MEKERWNNIQRLFNQAILFENSQRETYLKGNCSDDDELYAEVISLLEADTKSEAIFNDSVFPIVARLLDEDFKKLLETPEFGSYKLQKLLGKGGMSAVFLAEDTRLERPVAIKILPINKSVKNEFTKRFQLEAKAGSWISHQNVAHIYEFGRYDNFYFLAMEYVDGKTLREIIKEDNIDLKCAVNIALQTAKALDAAHKTGITHRDIKPENIMIIGYDTVKIFDFGLAKLNEKKNQNGNPNFKSTPGMIMGTVNYMSPEQIRGKEIDERTDLWSLGVVFYEMLTGKRPFNTENPADAQANILSVTPKPLPLAKELPEIEKIVRKALMKNASDRYQSAFEMEKDLYQLQRVVYDYLNQTDTSESSGFINFSSKSFIFKTAIILITLWLLVGWYLFDLF